MWQLFTKTILSIALTICSPTGWNTAVAAGGIVGGILLDRTGLASFAWGVIGLLLLSLLGTILAMNRALSQKA
jgi:predicted MFS family arabinose efflux permease